MFAPIPSASVTNATAVKPGLRRKALPAYRRSPTKSLTKFALRRSRHSSFALLDGAHRAQRGVSRRLRRETSTQSFVDLAFQVVLELFVELFLHAPSTNYGTKSYVKPGEPARHLGSPVLDGAHDP
jgi:hypothetical protein